MKFKIVIVLIVLIFLFSKCETIKNTPGFFKEALKWHNHYRSLHQVKHLVHEKKISTIAQKVADGMIDSKKLKHTNKTYMNKELGENLAMWSKSKTNTSEKAGKHCVELWYSEVKFHNYKKDYQKKSGHFSQLVWKSSTHVGFGLAVTNSSVICVAMYHPAGNVLRKFKDNVLPKKEKKKKTTAKTTKPTTTKSHRL